MPACTTFTIDIIRSQHTFVVHNRQMNGQWKAEYWLATVKHIHVWGTQWWNKVAHDSKSGKTVPAWKKAATPYLPFKTQLQRFEGMDPKYSKYCLRCSLSATCIHILNTWTGNVSLDWVKFYIPYQHGMTHVRLPCNADWMLFVAPLPEVQHRKRWLVIWNSDSLGIISNLDPIVGWQ